jgi:predicted transcriptional regulator
MPRPKNSSFRSYALILDTLIEGNPKCFEDIVKLTGLHRNTVGSRLKHLVSEDLVMKRRESHKILYSVVYPFAFEKWSKLSWRIFKELRKRKYKKLFKEIKNWQPFPELIKLERLSISKELLELKPELSELPVDKFQLILEFNRDLGNKIICPDCFQRTIEVKETKEVVCPISGIVIDDEIIAPRQRLGIILNLFKKESN